MRTTNLGTKPKLLDTKSDLILKCALCGYLYWVEIL